MKKGCLHPESLTNTKQIETNKQKLQRQLDDLFTSSFHRRCRHSVSCFQRPGYRQPRTTRVQTSLSPTFTSVELNVINSLIFQDLLPRSGCPYPSVRICLCVLPEQSNQLSLVAMPVQMCGLGPYIILGAL